MQLTSRSREPVPDEGVNLALDSLRRIVRALRVSSHAAEQSLGVTGAQLFVLQNLSIAPASSLRELAGRTLTDQSSVSVVVARLVERGLVVRRPSADDGRRIELSLTSAGRATLDKAPELPQTRLVRALQKAPPRELRAVARLLEGLAREVDGLSEPPEMFLERDVGARALSAKRRGRAASRRNVPRRKR